MSDKKKKAGQQYSEDNIRVLEGLDKVRMNAPMYMGDLGDSMVYRMVKEAVDNFGDEYQAGRNTGGVVGFSLQSNRYVIADFAQGIPVGMKKVGGKSVSTLTVVMTELHAGGKFDDKAYKTSGGTHGVGISATNALSSEFRVWTRRDGVWYFQEFAAGVAKHDVKKLGSDAKDIYKRNPFLKQWSKKLGTVIEFVPDQTCVSEDASRTKKVTKLTTAKLDWKFAGVWLKNLAMLNPGLEITYYDIDKDRSKTFLNKKGLPQLVLDMIAEHELEPISNKMLEFDSDFLKFAVMWTNHSDVDLFKSFVNSSPTIDHGTHVKGFRDALQAALKPLMPSRGMKDFKVDDLFIGSVGVFNWKMNSAQFSGQVKDKLVSKIDGDVYDLCAKHLAEFFDKNKKLGKEIIRRAATAGELRQQLQKVMKSMSEVKKASRNMLPQSLFEAPDCKPNERELYIVEGDSAGGTAKDARNRNQEVLKLSGKIPNALGTPLFRLLPNDRIQDLIISVGADPKSLDPKADNPTFSCDNLRVQNICLLADADPDGFHINTLLIAFFWRLFPDIIKQGRLFVVDAPLYNALYKGKHYGAMTAEECFKLMAKDNVPRQQMFRAKGWGEVPAEILDIIAFNEKSRKLIRVTEEKSKEVLAFYRSFIAEEASSRRKLLGLKG